MLTPLPVPLLPGSASLPLPAAGAAPHRGPTIPLAASALQAGEDVAPTAAFTTAAPPAVGAASAAQSSQAALSEPESPLPGTAPPVTSGAPTAQAEPRATPPPVPGGAAPMSLVLAQMQGGETVAMQALIAQQVASRALPRTSPRPATALDDLPRPLPEGAEPALAAALLGARAPTRWPLLPEVGPAPDDPAPPRDLAEDPWADLAAILRRWPPVAPPPERLPRNVTPWLIVGAITAGIFLYIVLSG